MIVIIRGKYNYLTRDGKLIWDKTDINEWFDYCHEFWVDGDKQYAVVMKNGKYNHLIKDGKLLWNKEDTKYWFKDCYEFNNGSAKVVLDDDTTQYISAKGNLFDTKEGARTDSNS